MLDKIEVPGSAKGTIVNTMMHTSAPPMGGPYPGLTGFMGMMRPGMMPGANAPQPRPEPDKPTEPKKEGPNFCPCCGYEVGPNHRKFCPECGSLLASE